MEGFHWDLISQKLSTEPDSVFYDRKRLRLLVSRLLRELGWLRKKKDLPPSTFSDWLRAVAPSMRIDDSEPLPEIFGKEWIKELLFLGYWRKESTRQSLKLYRREDR